MSDLMALNFSSWAASYKGTGKDSINTVHVMVSPFYIIRAPPCGAMHVLPFIIHITSAKEVMILVAFACCR